MAEHHDRSSFRRARHASRLSLAAKLYSIFALVRAPDRRHHRAVRLQHPPQRRTHRSDRDRQPRRAQCRARQFAGLCGGDGIPRRLHVDGAGRREEIRRRAAQVQRADPGRGQEWQAHRPGRRRRAVRHLQEAHRAVRRFPQGAGAPRRRDQRRRRPRMGRQRRQPRGALGAEQGSRGAVQGLCRTQQAASREQTETNRTTGLRPDLSRRAGAGAWSSSASSSSPVRSRGRCR